MTRRRTIQLTAISQDGRHHHAAVVCFELRRAGEAMALIRQAIKDFLATPGGRLALDDVAPHPFDWGEALERIPAHHWQKHGLRLFVIGPLDERHLVDSHENLAVDCDRTEEGGTCHG